MKRSTRFGFPSLALAASALGLVVLSLAAPAAHAQCVVVQNGPPDGFVIRELGAVIVPDPAGDAALVEHTFDREQRPAAYRDVDIAAGDRVLAANGKRVRSAKEVEAAYGAVAVGGQVELGIERKGASGPQRRIVAFAKADPAKMPQPQMRMVRIEGSPDAEVEVMPALGVVLSQKHAAGSPVEVTAVLPNGDDLFRAGDRVVSLDGKPVADLADFGERWDAIAVGAPVKMVVENGGKRRDLAFARKKAPEGQRTIQH